MIGVFDSGIGGLTVLRALTRRFPGRAFVYLGDHANMPYGDRASEDIVTLTETGVETLFSLGCRLVLLGCNTATAAAARRLQRNWLPTSRWSGHNVLGIVAPTVEAATQTPWAVTTPQYPQKYNADTIAVFATVRTIASGVFSEEILKRCPRVTVVPHPCPGLADAIENRSDDGVLDAMVATAVHGVMQATDGRPPHRAILGCTHYPLVEAMFQRHLPPHTRLLSQPDVVADSLEDYLTRHPSYLDGSAPSPGVRLLTTGTPGLADHAAAPFWPDAPGFERLSG
jgi:glutamate racemase